MESILLSIKEKYSQMGHSEKLIADWLMKNFSDMMNMSISQLADNCGCGEATIVRFYKQARIDIPLPLRISRRRRSPRTYRTSPQASPLRLP